MQAKLSNRSKGRYAQQAYFNPKSKNVPHSEDVFDLRFTLTDFEYE